MVASTGLRRFAWPAAAGAAAALIVVLALDGGRLQPGLSRFAPAGVLADWRPGQVSEVMVGTPELSRTFRRGPAGEWRSSDGPPATAELAERIETGLTLLRNSPPQRTLHAIEMSERPLVEFGLVPPRLTVSARGENGDSVTIAFGSTNPLGLARYARIDARPELLLLSSYVAEAWERVAEQP